MKLQGIMVKKFIKIKSFSVQKLNYKMKALMSNEVSCAATREDAASSAVSQFLP